MRKAGMIILAVMSIVLYAGCGKKSQDSGGANTPPLVVITGAPTGIETGDITIDYSLLDDNWDTCSVTVEYSINGGTTYSSATRAGGDFTIGLASSPTGESYTFVWGSVSDIGTSLQELLTIRITPHDGTLEGTPVETGIFTVNNNDAPLLNIQTPSGPQIGDVTISYLLIDQNSDTCSITVEYSINGGTDYSPATPGTGGDGISGLSSLPAGQDHTFVWDSLIDIGVAIEDSVRIRITPHDGIEDGTSAETGIFSVGNNDAPSVVIQTPAGIQSGDATIDYTLYDNNSHTCSITVEFSINGGGSYSTATEGSGGSGITGLSSSPAGIAYTFVWDSAADTGAVIEDSVKIRITPNDSIEDGASVETDVFTVNNNTAPSVTITTPPSPQTSNITIDYILQDGNSHTCSVAVEYSIDNGADYYPAKEGSGGSGITGLTSSPGGTPHTFVWDSVADVGNNLYNNSVRIRITPHDGYEFGASDATADFTVDNSALWLIETVDTECDIVEVDLFRSTSIDFDSSNKAHMSYVGVWWVDAANKAWYMKYATNISGSWVDTTVHTLDVPYFYSSISVDGADKSHISFRDASTKALRYATNSGGGWVAITIDSSTKICEATGIASDSSNYAHIIYSYYYSGRLMYANNTSGSWSYSQIIQAGTDVKFNYTSIAVDNSDYVHVCYDDERGFKFDYATNASGSWVVTNIDTGDRIGRYNDIGIDTSDKVHISYYDRENKALKYATDTSGSWQTFTVDTDHVGKYTSIAVDTSDKIHISYYDSGYGNLKYATNESGSWATYTLDSKGDVGYATHIAVDLTGIKHITYMDQDNDDVKYVTFDAVP